MIEICWAERAGSKSRHLHEKKERPLTHLSPAVQVGKPIKKLAKDQEKISGENFTGQAQEISVLPYYLPTKSLKTVNVSHSLLESLAKWLLFGALLSLIEGENNFKLR